MPSSRSFTSAWSVWLTGAVLLARLGLGVFLGGGLFELLALGVGQDVAVALEEVQMRPGTDPIRASGCGRSTCSRDPFRS